MHVSVVIPTYNRAWIFPQTLPALLNQQTGEHTYELIIVANGSTDGTSEVLKAAAASHPDRVRYHWIQPTGGPSGPRNAGIRAATGDIVIITDDDVAPHPDFVWHHAEFHRKFSGLEDAAVGPVYVPERLKGDPMSLFHERYSYESFHSRDRLSFFDFWACNVSLKREFLLRYGMFDEKFLSAEDIEVAYRLECAGMQLRYLPEATGQHLHESNPATLEARAALYGNWTYELTRRIPPDLVRRRFGLITSGFGPIWFLKRLVRFCGLLLAANPVALAILRLLGGASEKRSPRTDLYYGLIFNRAFLMSYYRKAFQAS